LKEKKKSLSGNRGGVRAEKPFGRVCPHHPSSKGKDFKGKSKKKEGEIV